MSFILCLNIFVIQVFEIFKNNFGMIFQQPSNYMFWDVLAGDLTCKERKLVCHTLSRVLWGLQWRGCPHQLVLNAWEQLLHPEMRQYPPWDDLQLCHFIYILKKPTCWWQLLCCFSQVTPCILKEITSRHFHTKQRVTVWKCPTLQQNCHAEKAYLILF